MITLKKDRGVLAHVSGLTVETSGTVAVVLAKSAGFLAGARCALALGVGLTP